MARLPGPYELLDLQHEGAVAFRVVRFEEGDIEIKTTQVPEGKVVEVCRVHVPREDKPTAPFYWDITSKTLCAEILPHLKRPDLSRLRFKVTAFGVAPKKRFSLDIS
ncbi:MAG: hypothetical protein ACREJ8_09125 [Candidatus Methylomirabilales bacterium]